MQKKGIGVCNLPNLMYNKFTERGCIFNIMAVGSHGLGKTTFLNQLLGSKILKLDPFPPKEDNQFWHTEEICNIQTSLVKILEGDFMMEMNITEVDGVGDCIDNSNCYVPIINLLEKNFDDYHEKFKKSVVSQIDDKRVHLCLYFLEPISTIKLSDLENLTKISKYYTIIPIIAKADLINPENISKIKHNHTEILKANNIPFFEDSESTARAPFFIFTQDRSDSGYTWCSAPMSNSKINDFVLLRRLIMENCVNVIKKETNNYYDNYRVLKMLFNSSEDEGRRNNFEKKIEDYQTKVNVLQDKLKVLSCTQNLEEMAE